MADRSVSLPEHISTLPEDPVAAEGYVELHQLWTELRERLDGGDRLSDQEFRAWDQKVSSLLGPSEVARLQKPLRPHLTDERYTQDARVFHLTKILRARQGWEKLMKDTGY